MTAHFKLGFTADFLNPDGSLGLGDIGIGHIENRPVIVWSYLSGTNRELTPEQIAGYDGLGVLAPRITAATLEGADKLTLVARYGVGYDSVDVDACTRHGVVVTITPDAVRRTMATSAVTFILAGSHRLLEQDRATRAGEGWKRKLELMGTGLQNKTLGMIGLGNIGSEIVRLAKPFGLHPISFDPYVRPEKAAELGVRLVDLETLMSESDFVVVMCALTPETRGLVSRDLIAKMKPTAFIVNVARGPIIDQAALTEALQERRIRGAGLDVFEQEPISSDDPLLTLDNVMVTPHGLGWTDEWATLTGISAMDSVIAIAEGREPTYVVNREVLATPAFQAKLAAYRAARGG